MAISKVTFTMTSSTASDSYTVGAVPGKAAAVLREEGLIPVRNNPLCDP